MRQGGRSEDDCHDGGAAFEGALFDSCHSGMEMVLRDEQRVKAYRPMLVKAREGKERRAGQLANAQSPTLINGVIVSTETRLVQPRKACCVSSSLPLET